MSVLGDRDTERNNSNGLSLIQPRNTVKTENIWPTGESNSLKIYSVSQIQVVSNIVIPYWIHTMWLDTMLCRYTRFKKTRYTLFSQK